MVTLQKRVLPAILDNHKYPFFVVVVESVTEGGISFASCTFNRDHYTDNLYLQAGISHFSGFSRSVSKRKAEYFAGRYLIRRTLLRLKEPAYDIPIGHNRAPVWPVGLQGSLTHTGNKGISAIAKHKVNYYLGIDIEEKLSEASRKEIENLICCQNEAERLQPSFEDKEALVTFVFSAKESLFKALYPYVEVYFDFLDAEVITLEEYRFEIKLVKSINSSYVSGMIFKGFFCKKEEITFTIITNHQISLSSLQAILCELK
ncbi:MAG: 4'-phosphopantetheinyl transferase superfamily protein [Colwellia sp.]|nr:4'-phosphopantetheinyl transferase superfamily protein [Colwellia sp.]